MKIKLALSDSGTSKTKEVEVNGYKTPDSALVVHKQTWVRNGEVTTGKSWVITHVPSGMNIFSGYTKKIFAIDHAAKMSLLANWNDITPENCGEWYDKNKEAMLELKRNIN